MKQNKFWLKLIGTALLLHVALILLTILEVAIYSYLIDPGHPQEFYEKHANESGPWISAVFGSLFMFILVKRYLKRFATQQLTYTIGLPTAYLIIDLVILFAAGYKLSDFVSEYLISSAPKIAAVTVAYMLYRHKK